MTANSDDPWRPACGACGATSLRPRVATQAGVEPAVHYYECTACGRAWDGSEAPEASRDEDLKPPGVERGDELLTRLYLGPLANGHDE